MTQVNDQEEDLLKKLKDSENKVDEKTRIYLSTGRSNVW
jgi:hypothetical protein